MANTDTTNHLYNVRIIGKTRSYRATMIATSQHDAERRCRNLGRFPTTCGVGGPRRIDVKLAHGPLPQEV